MITYYLYVKTHSTSGLKYLGYTTKNPTKYKGSGLYWRRHLKKYGSEHTTEVLLETTDKNELRSAGVYYSVLWNVVGSDKWANMIPESGVGVVQNTSTTAKAVATKTSNGTLSNGVKAMRSAEIQKKAGLNSRKTYQFTSPDGEVITATGLLSFCKDHGLDHGNMSAIAHGRKQLKTHKGWSCKILDA